MDIIMRRRAMLQQQDNKKLYIYQNGVFIQNFKNYAVSAPSGFTLPDTYSFSPTIYLVCNRASASQKNRGIIISGSAVDVSQYNYFNTVYSFEWVGTAKTGNLGSIYYRNGSTTTARVNLIDMINGEYSIKSPILNGMTSFNQIVCQAWLSTYNFAIRIELIYLTKE